MCRSCFNAVLFLSLVLMLFFTSPGFGRKMMKSPDHEENNSASVFHEIWRKMMMELDYAPTGPNVNGQSGIFSPPPPPPAASGPEPDIGYKTPSYT